MYIKNFSVQYTFISFKNNNIFQYLKTKNITSNFFFRLNNDLSIMLSKLLFFRWYTIVNKKN